MNIHYPQGTYCGDGKCRLPGHDHCLASLDQKPPGGLGEPPVNKAAVLDRARCLQGPIRRRHAHILLGSVAALNPRVSEFAVIRETDERASANRDRRAPLWSTTSRSRFPRDTATSTRWITPQVASGSTGCCSPPRVTRPTMATS